VPKYFYNIRLPSWSSLVTTGTSAPRSQAVKLTSAISTLKGMS